MKNKTTFKYRNKKTYVVIDGIEYKFDSQIEAERGVILNSFKKRGIITDLEFQKKFRIFELECKRKVSEKYLKAFITNKREKIDYIADFYYYDTKINKIVIEDVKSNITIKKADYVIKRKLMIEWIKNNIGTDLAVFRECLAGKIIDWTA